MSPALVILAAGAGRRYGGLKQLAAMGPRGEALLEYSIFDALATGFERIVLVVRPETEPEFRRRLDNGAGRRASLIYVHQTLGEDTARNKPWGTGHAVLAAEGAVDGPFAVVNADDFYGAESYAALARFFRQPTASTPTLGLVGFELASTLPESGAVSRALCELDEHGRLRSIVEIAEIWRQGERIFHRDAQGSTRRLDGSELVSMNMWAFPGEIFAVLRHGFEAFLARRGGDAEAEYLLPDAVRGLLDQAGARVEVLRGAGRWCGITYRDDERATADFLRRQLAQGGYPERLWL